MAELKLAEIAKRISAHLRRFEADSEINAERFYTSHKDGSRQSSGKPYYHAGAIRAGNRVGVLYVSYQGWSYLTKAEALRYLEALDGGYVGRHFSLRD